MIPDYKRDSETFKHIQKRNPKIQAHQFPITNLGFVIQIGFCFFAYDKHFNVSYVLVLL